MRRHRQAITDPVKLESILAGGMVCRLAMADGEGTYIVPLCYGYQDGSLYFHTAGEGLKLDLLSKDDRVCFEVETDVKVLPGKNAADWSMSYRSIVGHGRISLVSGVPEKRKAMKILMEHYSGRADWEITNDLLRRTTVLRLRIEEMTGKASSDRMG